MKQPSAPSPEHPFTDEVQVLPDIPKSLELFQGDINAAVIEVQAETGITITADWWEKNVGNTGSTESILTNFDSAFTSHVQNMLDIGPASEEKLAVDIEPDDPETQEEPNFTEIEGLSETAQQELVIAEAEAELADFDKRFAGKPESAALRQEFLVALTEHLREKYFADDLLDQDEPVEHSSAAQPDDMPRNQTILT